MTRFIALGFLSSCLFLAFNNQAHAQVYQINNGFAGIYPDAGYGYDGQRTDPRLGYCLKNDCFAGQGPYAHTATIGGGYGGCGHGGYRYGHGGYGYGGCGHCGCGGHHSSIRIRITIYPGGAGVPPVVQTDCPYCNVRVNPGVYTTASSGRTAARLPASTARQPAVPGKNRSYKYKF
jgi:hypothetical protein